MESTRSYLQPQEGEWQLTLVLQSHCRGREGGREGGERGCSSLETRPSPSSKYYNTYAHAPYVNYAGVFFQREKAWKIFARGAWRDHRVTVDL